MVETTENYALYSKLALDSYTLPENYFAVKMIGDSMDMANIPDGSVAIIDRMAKVKDGEIAAVSVGGEVTIKRIYDKRTHLVLAPVSANPVYQPQVYSPADQIEILGKVSFVMVNVG